MDIVDIIYILRQSSKFKDLIAQTKPGEGLFIAAHSLELLKMEKYFHQYMSAFRLTKKIGGKVFLELLNPEHIIIAVSLSGQSDYFLYLNPNFTLKTCDCKETKKDLRCKVCKNFYWCTNCQGHHDQICKDTVQLDKDLKQKVEDLAKVFNPPLRADQYLLIYSPDEAMVVELQSLDKKLGATPRGCLVEVYNKMRKRFEYLKINISK